MNLVLQNYLTAQIKKREASQLTKLVKELREKQIEFEPVRKAASERRRYEHHWRSRGDSFVIKSEEPST